MNIKAAPFPSILFSAYIFPTWASTMFLTLAVQGELTMLLFQFYYYETPITCKLHRLTRTSVVAGSTGIILYPLPIMYFGALLWSNIFTCKLGSHCMRWICKVDFVIVYAVLVYPIIVMIDIVKVMTLITNIFLVLTTSCSSNALLLESNNTSLWCIYDGVYNYCVFMIKKGISIKKYRFLLREY